MVMFQVSNLSKPCLQSGKRITQPGKIAHDTTKCKYFSDFLRDFKERVTKQNHFKLKKKITKTRTKMVAHNSLVLFSTMLLYPLKLTCMKLCIFDLLCCKALFSPTAE